MSDRQSFGALTLVATGLGWGRGGMALGEGMDFSVTNSQCLLLRGPNGTGKTTLLLTLVGVLPAMSGSFTLQGGDEDERLIHYCGHRNAIKPRLTVLENLSFWAEINGPTGVAPQAALDEVGLGHIAELDAGYLSAGQSRRLALARLLVTNRPLWLLDEPTAALDAEGHDLVTRLLDCHLDRGGFAIAATHDPITLPDPARMETLVLGARP